MQIYITNLLKDEKGNMVFSTKNVALTGWSHIKKKKKKLVPYFTLYTRINSRWNADPHVKGKNNKASILDMRKYS